MPAIRSYIVSETREVPIAAASPAEAIEKADGIFRGIDENPKLDGQGRIMTGPVRVTSVDAREQ